MTGNSPLISTGNLTPTYLVGQIAIVTGSGGGIGYEAARALAWLGAHVRFYQGSKTAGGNTDDIKRLATESRGAGFAGREVISRRMRGKRSYRLPARL